MNITILYFAKLAEKFGTGEEKLSLDTDSLNVSELVALLSERGDIWQELLNDKGTRCAVDQSIAQTEQSIYSGAEVAFFPPVTGG
ncbi:molybdopterin converting factor subunit 1 [Agaribacterium sp. ZY112]|uniref:molybdopterin converting factor subunit 1 n=1 Tax=Agaribacterium sp. ZY112 TaxID=3233574 RepID=UPI003525801A